MTVGGCPDCEVPPWADDLAPSGLTRDGYGEVAVGKDAPDGASNDDA